MSMRHLLACLATMALLAGCAAPASLDTTSSGTTSHRTDGAVGAPMLVPPAHAENESQGLRLVGDQDRSGIADGESVTFTFNATNVGAAAITWGGCYRPFAYSLEGPDGTERVLRAESAQCLGFTEDPFPAGASMEATTTWNGTYAEGEAYVRAEPGVHAFTATFSVRRGDGWGDLDSVTVTLPVTVLPPNSI